MVGEIFFFRRMIQNWDIPFLKLTEHIEKTYIPIALIFSRAHDMVDFGGVIRDTFPETN